MLVLHNISYTQPSKKLVFANVNLTINEREKTALIGHNGSGKSTLLKIIAKELEPLEGQCVVNVPPYFIPQIYGQYNQLTIAQALKIDAKLNALKAIMNGDASEKNYDLLNDDWMIEERCKDALKHWKLCDLDLSQKMETLSGGQKTKVFLSGISIHQPELILLDEPSNHLDLAARQLLYDFIATTKSTLLVVSHDRKLLNLLNKVAELSKNGISSYGGNYDFYIEQKQLEVQSLNHDLESKEKALRKAKDKERDILERQQKLNSKGKGKQEKAGVARIMMNTLRNNAENSTSKLKGVHAEKIGAIKNELQEIRSVLPDIDKMRVDFDNSALHKGKTLIKAEEINFAYHDHYLWKDSLTFQIKSGERIILNGLNGSGKTTLIKIILGELTPQNGTIYSAKNKTFYIDQDYLLINDHLNVYEQAQRFNISALQEHEIKVRLNRFLFTKDDWDKSCSLLSGGEKMRLILCCLTITSQPPDIIILDEPSNNLDLQSLEILTSAINDYQGALIVVSHDQTFLEKLNITKVIDL